MFSHLRLLKKSAPEKKFRIILPLSGKTGVHDGNRRMVKDAMAFPPECSRVKTIRITGPDPAFEVLR
jgi:hypothetical protein